MRAKHDDVGLPFLCVTHDQVGSTATHTLDQRGFGDDAGFAHPGHGLGENCLAGITQHVDGLAHQHACLGRGHEHEFIHDVDQPDAGLLVLGQPHRGANAQPGGHTSVHRYKNALEHDDSSLKNGLRKRTNTT